MATEYDNEFYNRIAEGSSSSAARIVPLVFELYDIATVVDVGCGTGLWAKAFEIAGAAAVGIDGDYVDAPVIDDFIAYDINEPLDKLGLVKFDLVVCLEVAEHLPESRAESFVSDLCNLSDVVLFSAAIPHQTGTNHINLQWQSYWAKKFFSHGYGAVDVIRWQVWDDDSVEAWYRQNVVIYEKGKPQVLPPDVVHPVIHEWGR